MFYIYRISVYSIVLYKMPPRIAKKTTGATTTVSKKKSSTTPSKNGYMTEKYISPSSSTEGFTHYLVIVESPSKCKKIEEFLGNRYQCIATKGHLREIEGLRAIHSKNQFEIVYTPISSKTRHIENMKTILSNYHYTNIFIASDDDREGEAIAWHICEIFGLPIDLTPRIVFHEITANAVQTAIEHPRTVDMNLVKAQHARQILDMQIGFKISPYLWKYIYSSKSSSLSAGRCQTPALRLVYDNEMEKKDDLDKRYKTTAYFFTQLTPFVLKKEWETEEKVETFLNHSMNYPYSLHVGESRDSVKQPPKPWNTSRILQAASNTMHASPKETMQLLQTLYQDGYITYMRTESMKYSKEFIEKASVYIEKEWNATYLPKKEDWKSLTANANNPHEAIRVTKIEVRTISKENPRLSTLYKMIWKNTIQSLMTAARYKCNTIEITAPLDTVYTHVLESPLFLGWQVVDSGRSGDGGTGGPENITQIQMKNESMLLYYKTVEQTKQSFSVDHIESILTVHLKHSHYSESTLIHKLEEIGIGRPSTFSLLVDTIQDRGYVKKTNVPGVSVQATDYKMKNGKITRQTQTKVFGAEKNKLVIQPMGILTIEFLLQYFGPIFSYAYSKNMEDELDKIASASASVSDTEKEKEPWYSICQHCQSEIKELSKQLNHLGKQTYPIDDLHSVAFQQYGPVIRKAKEDGTFEYKSIRKDIQLDLHKLKDSVYTLNELLEIPDENLGTYKNIPVYLKSGQYGVYIEYAGSHQSIRTIQKPTHLITLEDVLPFIEPDTYVQPVGQLENSGGNECKQSDDIEDIEDKEGENTEKKKSQKDPPTDAPILRRPPPMVENKNVLRTITPDMSIRKGKFGAYIYYKTGDMKNPEFFSLQKFKKGFQTCSKEELMKWIFDTHQIPKTNL